MATRFYLPVNGTPLISPAFSASWEETAAATRLMCYDYKSSTTIATSAVTKTGAATNDVLGFQYVSEPITAVTISGTCKGIIRVSESVASNDCRAQLVIKVMSGDGSVERGVLLAENAGALASEYSTSLTNRKFPLAWAGAGTAVSSVDAQEGDRVVIEIGTKFHVVTTSISSSYSLGDSSATDCAENETATTANNPWIELSTNLTFIRTTSLSEGVVNTNYNDADINAVIDAEIASLCSLTGGVATTTFYIMRGKDVDCGSVTYRTWTVTSEPDTTGALYSGPKCGASALQDIIIVKKVVI